MESSYGYSTKPIEDKDQMSSFKTIYPKRFLTVDPASEVAVSELKGPTNLSLYYSFIPMD